MTYSPLCHLIIPCQGNRSVRKPPKAQGESRVPSQNLALAVRSRCCSRGWTECAGPQLRELWEWPAEQRVRRERLVVTSARRILRNMWRKRKGDDSSQFWTVHRRLHCFPGPRWLVYTENGDGASGDMSFGLSASG